MASAVATSSSALDAPSAWPCIDLVEETVTDSSQRKKKKKAIEEQKPEESGIRGLLASTQASLMKRLTPPPESDGQGSNSGESSKDQSKQSGQKKADAKGS